MKTYLDLRVKRAGDAAVRIDTVYLSPAAGRGLPFTSSDGVTLSRLPSGRPAAGVVRGALTVFLRGPGCPMPNWNDPAILKDTGNAADKVRRAVAEYRRYLGGVR